jgi:hypothetical protein
MSLPPTPKGFRLLRNLYGGTGRRDKTADKPEFKRRIFYRGPKPDQGRTRQDFFDRIKEINPVKLGINVINPVKHGINPLLLIPCLTNFMV